MACSTLSLNMLCDIFPYSPSFPLSLSMSCASSLQGLGICSFLSLVITINFSLTILHNINYLVISSLSSTLSLCLHCLLSLSVIFYF